MPQLTFLYEFASTYSYLSAMRIAQVAGKAGVSVTWQPFLLGPIFKAQGWHDSPFNIYPAKGRYMVRDIERIAAARGLVFRMPKEFPANGLTAARIALLDLAPGWTETFSRMVFEAQFGRGEDIADTDVLARISAQLDQNFTSLVTLAATDDSKRRLRQITERAVRIGVFGAPSFVTSDGELFWGDDRLEQAVNWALQL